MCPGGFATPTGARVVSSPAQMYWHSSWMCFLLIFFYILIHHNNRTSSSDPCIQKRIERVSEGQAHIADCIASEVESDKDVVGLAIQVFHHHLPQKCNKRLERGELVELYWTIPSRPFLTSAAASHHGSLNVILKKISSCQSTFVQFWSA
jgi:hypothetical protein